MCPILSVAWMLSDILRHVLEGRRMRKVKAKAKSSKHIFRKGEHKGTHTQVSERHVEPK